MRALRSSLLATLLATVAFAARADSTARYESTGDTVLDRATGLRWQFVVYNTPLRAWYEALDYCENLTARDFNDWRLPTAKELLSLSRDDGTVDSSLGEPEDPANGYWSSTVTRNPNVAWIVQGNRMFRSTGAAQAFVRCVR